MMPGMARIARIAVFAVQRMAVHTLPNANAR